MSFCFERGISHSQWLSWSLEDRNKMLAYMIEKSSTCSLCGTGDWEWSDNKFAYEPGEKFCRGCYLKETSAQDANRLPGTTIELYPVTEYYRAEQEVTRKRRAGMSMKDED